MRPVADHGRRHLSGSLGLDVLAGHARRGSLHPLVPLPTPAIGAERPALGNHPRRGRRPGDPDVAEDLGGKVVEVADADRAAYHAAAVIAANHLVALMGQVERVAATAGLPLAAFAGLMRAATEDALALGPAGAHRARRPRRLGHGGAPPGGDRPMPAHRTELAGYDAMVALARRLSLDTAGGPRSDGRSGRWSGRRGRGRRRAGAWPRLEQVA